MQHTHKHTNAAFVSDPRVQVCVCFRRLIHVWLSEIPHTRSEEEVAEGQSELRVLVHMCAVYCGRLAALALALCQCASFLQI